jgi:hypothetical protein
MVEHSVPTNTVAARGAFIANSRLFCMDCDRMAIPESLRLVMKLPTRGGDVVGPSGFSCGVHGTRRKLSGRELRKRRSAIELRTPATQPVRTPEALVENLRAQGFRGMMTGGTRGLARGPGGDRGHLVALAPVTRVQESSHCEEPVLFSLSARGRRGGDAPPPVDGVRIRHHCVRGFQPLRSERTMMA